MTTLQSQLMMSQVYVNYINYARQWVCREKVRFKGNVSEPSFFNMEEEDRHNAIKAVQEEDDTSAKDPFLFIFEYKADHDMFLEECVDPQNLVVACGHDEIIVEHGIPSDCRLM